MQFERVAFYKQHKESPYYREIPSEEKFEKIFAELLKISIELLCKLEPSRAEEYKTLPERYHAELHYPAFYDTVRDSYCGIEDEESPLYKNQMRKNYVRIAVYLRFLYERDYDKENLDKIEIKNPMYIVALPRSGTTFTHRLLGSDPKAKGIPLYVHFGPGSKTMSLEGRFGIIKQIVGELTTMEGGAELNQVHALDVLTAPEEELLFHDMLFLMMMIGNTLPRWEQIREGLITRNYDYVYKATIDEMKMTAVEQNFNFPNYFCMKCVSHFMTPSSFFGEMCKDEFTPRIVWVHREPIGNLKSVILLYWNCRGGYEIEPGVDDKKWVNDNTIEMNEIMLRNAIACREQWIAENPERKKYIIDIGFQEIIKKPIETAKKIYDYFGMEFTQEVEDAMKHTLEHGDPQKNVGKKAHDESMYTFNADEVRERFRFYYEKFGEYIPDFWGKKD